MKRAAIYFGLQDYQLAIEDLSEVMQVSSDAAIALINRANAYAILGRYEEALEDIDEALSFNLALADHAQAFSIRGRIYCQTGRFEDAERDLSEVLRDVPNHASALKWRSKARFGIKQHDACIADCTTLIEMDTQARGDVRWRRGACYAAVHQNDRALIDLDQAIRLSPSMWRAWMSRAFVYQKLGKYEDAIRDFSAALQLRPQYVYGLDCRAECHLNFDRFEPAIADCRSALEIEPDNINALKIRARAFEASGHRQEALADLERAIELSQDNATLLAELRERRNAIRGSFPDAQRDFGSNLNDHNG